MIFGWKTPWHQYTLVGNRSQTFHFHVRTVGRLSVLLSDTVSSLGLYVLTYAYVQTVCTLACVPLLFLNCDKKCYGPNWVVRGMLSPILSLSVPSDALQAREDGLGDVTMCPASIIWPVQSPNTAKRWSSVCHYKNRSVKMLYGFSNGFHCSSSSAVSSLMLILCFALTVLLFQIWLCTKMSLAHC